MINENIVKYKFLNSNRNSLISYNNVKARLKHMKERSSESKPQTFDKESLDLITNQFILKIFELCKFLKYSKQTFFQSYKIFREVVKKIEISFDLVEPLSYVSLMLASKFNEDAEKILTPFVLDKMCPSLNIQQILFLEAKVFFLLDCNLRVSSIYDFFITLLELDETVVTVDKGYQFDSIDAIKDFFIKKGEKLINLFIFTNYYNKFSPDVVSISIIFLIRSLLGYSDIPFKNWDTLMKIDQKEVKGCLKYLMDCLQNEEEERDQAEHTKDPISRIANIDDANLSTSNYKEFSSPANTEIQTNLSFNSLN